MIIITVVIVIVVIRSYCCSGVILIDNLDPLLGALNISLYVNTINTEFTEAVNDNTDGISKHRPLPYNAHYVNYTFYLVSVSSTL